MPLDTWLAFVAASSVLVLIPGPTILLVLSYALSQGRRVALATVLGVGTGDLVAMTISVAGLGAVILASASLFSLIKWAGAAYLVFMGARMILQAGKGTPTREAEAPRLPARKVWRNAATVTALNPKSIGFFVAFVPQFIDPHAAFAPQAAILIATFVTLGVANALAYALLASALRGQIQRPSVLAWLNRLGGTVLIAMGIATASLRRVL